MIRSVRSSLRGVMAAGFLFSPLYLFPLQVLAEDEPLTTVESVGFYEQTDPRSYGAGIFQGVKRSELIYFIKNINRSDPIMDKAYNALLLTQADMGTLNNDIPAQKSENLTALRMKKLIDRGLAGHAAKIYSKFEDVSEYESIARQGVLALLLNAQKGLACLEVKTLLPSFEDQKMWQDLDLLCASAPKEEKIAKNKNIVLKAVIREPEYVFEYQRDTFAALAIISKAILSAEKRIEFPKENFDLIPTLPALDVQILLRQENLTHKVEAALLARAADLGIIEGKQIIAFYERILESEDVKKDALSDIVRLAKLHDEIKESWLGVNRSQKIAQVMETIETYGDALLLPFVPVILKMDLGDDLSSDSAKRILRVMIHHDIEIPSDWVKDALGALENDKSEMTRHLFSMSTLIPIEENDWKDAKSALYDFMQSNTTALTIRNIIENIDIRHKYGDKFDYVYENDFDLAWNKSYTMPPALLLDALEHWSENQNTAMTLLATAYILGQIKPEHLHQETLGDIVIALDRTRLKRLSRRILAKRILEIEN